MANGLAAAFIADDGGNAVLISSTLNGTSWSTNTGAGQASNGSGPALAVFSSTTPQGLIETNLWAAFIANNSSRNVLVCSSADGVQWSANTDIGQASNGSAPALAVFAVTTPQGLIETNLWTAFIADNDSRNVLVCSSADGVHWTANTDIGQASNGSAPALAVFDNKLWVAFIANNSSRNVLVCSSADGVHWTANTDIGQASNGSAPSLAIFDNKLWVAFIADNDTNSVLVCSYPDAQGNWSANTDIGQASNGSAPALAVFTVTTPLGLIETRLWVAFIANNSSMNILVCSSADGVQWTANTDIGQASNGSAPSLAVFDGFFVRQCPAPSSTSDPVPAPNAGLGSNSNYIVLNADSQPILDLSISICISEDIVGSVGFGFQLNGYSPQNETCGWQQYGMAVLNDAEITGFVDNWPWNPLGAPNIINDFFSLSALSSANTLPAGYQLTITLANDADGNVTGATYIVVDRQNVTRAEVQLSLLAIAPAADIAPIIAFELDLVGPDNGQHSVLSSGAGTITYSASNLLTIASTLPPDAEASNTITAETANSFYGELPAGSASQFTQSFTSSISRPPIRRLGTQILRREPAKI
jgi:hypothetical protein